MTVKHPSLDYEPLRRTSSKSVAEDTSDEFHFKKPVNRLTPDEEIVQSTSARWKETSVKDSAPPARTSKQKSELEPVKEKWIHKHGHSVSYAGIFLFTAFVFFRPY